MREATGQRNSRVSYQHRREENAGVLGGLDSRKGKQSFNRLKAKWAVSRS